MKKRTAFRKFLSPEEFLVPMPQVIILAQVIQNRIPFAGRAICFTDLERTAEVLDAVNADGTTSDESLFLQLTP